MPIQLHSPTSAQDPAWLALRCALWPHATIASHQQEIAQLLTQPDRFCAFTACADSGAAIGLAEVSVRHDYVNGTHSSPVAFLEGLYVAPEARRQGVARQLLQAVRHWAMQRGCSELASDTSLDNLVSQAAHTSLGFVETERVVYFQMPLNDQTNHKNSL